MDREVIAKMRTCYIAAPIGVQLVTLRRVLAEKGYSVIAPDDLPIGSSKVTEISSVLPDVDLVVGVLTRERRSEWVLFELGQAWAAKRQILLFAPSKSVVPSNLRQVLVVRTSLSNREAIGFVLDQILASPNDGDRLQSNRQPAGKGAARSLGAGANTYIAKAEEALQKHDWLGLEDLVAEALRKSDVGVVSGRSTHGNAVDMAIWSEALQPFVGNPLLIEVRGMLQNANSARVAFRQLSEAIASSGTLWGLLVYGVNSREDKKVWADVPPNVLLISIFDLFERMRFTSFDQVVRDLRNQRVHRSKL